MDQRYLNFEDGRGNGFITIDDGVGSNSGIFGILLVSGVSLASNCKNYLKEKVIYSQSIFKMLTN